MGLKFDDLFPGRFIRAANFDGKDVTYTITNVMLEELEGDRGKEVKPIVSFSEINKQLVLNKTNALALKAMFGSEVTDWNGKRVTLYPLTIEWEGNDLAIRVRGSPDLEAPITFSFKLPRKRAREITLQRTSAHPAKENS